MHICVYSLEKNATRSEVAFFISWEWKYYCWRQRNYLGTLLERYQKLALYH